MKTFTTARRAVALAGVFVVAVVAFAAPAAAAAGASSAALQVSIFGISTGPLVSSSIGSSPNSLVSVSLGNSLTGSVSAGALTSAAVGNSTAGTSSADAGVTTLALTAPLSAFSVTLNAVTGHCALDANGNATMTSQIAGGTIAGPLGIPTLTIPVNPGPNTLIGIPGVLSVTLNEQSVANGVATVNAVDVQALGTSVGSVIIGHAACGPNAAVQGGAVATPWVIGLVGLAALVVLLGVRVGRYVHRRAPLGESA